MGNRHVPFLSGLAALGLAVWITLSFTGWWRYIVGTLLLAFGWVSLKTAIFATDREIHELTTPGPVSKKTEERLKDRF
jgi:hypothetical protein